MNSYVSLTPSKATIVSLAGCTDSQGRPLYNGPGVPFGERITELWQKWGYSAEVINTAHDYSREVQRSKAAVSHIRSTYTAILSVNNLI